MKLERFIEIMQEIAPVELAAEFDNPGLIIDGDGREIKKVLVALDCSEAVASEAVQGGYDLVLTHHPLIFNPIKRILRSNAVTAPAYALIRSGTALFSAHTNLDAADGGVNDVLCEIFGLENCIKVEPEKYGRVGELEKALSLTELQSLTDSLLQTCSRCAVAHFRSDPQNIMVKRVAVMGGSGGDDIEHMLRCGADVYITGEIKHDKAIAAQHMGLSVIAAGHYETEKVVLAPLIRCLQKYDFDVEYNLSQCESSPLRRI